METIIESNKTFKIYEYPKEADLEKHVKNNFKLIFGEDALFFPLKQKIESSYGIKGIPDAFLIDLKSNKFFIVEAELKEHDFYEHILGQITRFKSAFDKEENKRKIFEAIYESLNSKDQTKVKLIIKSNDVFRYIDKVIHEEFGIIVIIDEKTIELEELRKNYLPSLECIEFKTYKFGNKEIYKVDWFIKGVKEVGGKRIFKEYSIEDNLNRANPEIKENFKALKNEIFKLPKVKEKVGNHYSDYRIEGSRKGTFVNVNIRKDRLLILIKMGKRHLKDPKKISYSVPSQWGYGDLTKGFSIDSKEDVNYAMELIKQAYEYTKD